MERMTRDEALMDWALADKMLKGSLKDVNVLKRWCDWK
jgi:hypothetical protein